MCLQYPEKLTVVVESPRIAIRKRVAGIDIALGFAGI
jgi:hypothetical protein